MNAVLDQSRASTAAPRRRTAWWRFWLGLAASLLALDVCTFLYPPVDSPRRTDLIVVLGPWQETGRVVEGARLAHRYPDSALYLSVYNLGECALLRRVTRRGDAQCFIPDPFSTRGEARAAADFARLHGYRSMTMVTTGDQLVRGGVRFRRCFAGPVRLAEGRSSFGFRWDRFLYQNAAMVKALVVERTC